MTRSVMVSAVSAWCVSLALSCAAASDANAADAGNQGATQLGVSASTLGLGLSAGYDFSESLAVRGMVNYFSFSYDTEKSGNEYDGDLDLQSIGALLDWHPMGGGFRVTGGLLLNDNALSVAAESEDLDIGGHPYEGTLSVDVGFDSIAPYLGLGWSGNRGRSGWSFILDAGVVFQGAPSLTGSGMVSSSGQECRFDVSENGNASLAGDGCRWLDSLESDLEMEHGDLNDDLDDFKLYPVLSAGVSYRF